MVGRFAACTLIAVVGFKFATQPPAQAIVEIGTPFAIAAALIDNALKPEPVVEKPKTKWSLAQLQKAQSNARAKNDANAVAAIGRMIKRYYPEAQ